MPCWYYEKKDLKRETPSIHDGIDFETESRYRKEGARFIIDTGTKMGLRYDTMATGVVYFHRFYMFHSFKEFPRYVTACCCLFLAGKVEETPKKCKDIIKVAKASLSEAQFQQFGEDAKEEVMTLERILLQTIRFDLQVEHPYGYLIKYAKSLKGDKSKLQKMVQMAWTFVNDSLCTTLCLQWEPEVIAIALMYLAGKLSKFEITDWSGRQPRHIRWWDMFVEDISLEILEDICHQVLDLYSQQPARTDSPQGNAGVVPTKVQPVLPITTPTKPIGGRGAGGFDQRRTFVSISRISHDTAYSEPPCSTDSPTSLPSSASANSIGSVLPNIFFFPWASVSSYANFITTTSPSSSPILKV
uniref:Cyclin-K n=1 Tax=Daphnia longispina TaxID=42846 RepID=A0A4Y7M468_9CRUS|nr:EOG090X09KD [Daphnia longispina]